MQQLKTAERKRAKIKMALQGPSGSGKTYGALLIAFGLCNDWSKVAVIDSESHSANLYAHLGKYNVLDIRPPFTPEKYIEAISICEMSAMDVIIIDSLSHEWDGTGGILDVHGNMAGNSFTNWSKLTPRHNGFVEAILQSSCHVIGTIRSKQDYVLQEKNGKMIPEKVGLKGVTRENMDYEFTLVFDMDIKHFATASKDRTGLFANSPAFIPNEETGKAILDWCNQGREPSSIGNRIDANTDEIIKRVESCKTVSELLSLYKLYPRYQGSLHDEFANKKKLLENKNIINTQNLSSNGTSNNK